MKARRLALVLLALLCLAATACRPERPRDLKARLSVAESLRGPVAEGFAQVLAPRAFRFPADHGPHPEFRTEWWYYTGNLATQAGRRFGFQLTFFRHALSPHPPERASRWAASQVYLAHFALTDVEGGRFHSFERLERGALGLAGAEALPFRVWLGDWSSRLAGGPEGVSTATPMHLRAAAHAADTASIDLTLEAGKPPVLEGDHGLSRKGAEPGQASYYYSLSRMPAAGTVGVGGERFAVSGLAWMDREWSTRSLGRDQVGWDWFALQLADGREVMLYRLRRRDGSVDPSSSGTLIAADGSSRPLSLADFRLETSGSWTSPRSGARYPARFRLRLPAAGLDLDVRPLLADQELDTSFRYWEGAVAVAGTVAGSGYVELTGYAEPGGGI
ncbi:MAG TPA: lipocalin-like domain-containing protein [Thermoanaerobaculia bacterium]|nr:lipocalin-like domain-containing protein [Thermoanaerobaculia bacterium]